MSDELAQADEGAAMSSRQVEGPDLRSVPCPSCERVGTLAVRERLVSLPVGAWSLAGQQTKFSAIWLPQIICSADGCDFVKAPSARE